MLDAFDSIYPGSTSVFYLLGKPFLRHCSVMVASTSLQTLFDLARQDVASRVQLAFGSILCVGCAVAKKQLKVGTQVITSPQAVRSLEDLL